MIGAGRFLAGVAAPSGRGRGRVGRHRESAGAGGGEGDHAHHLALGRHHRGQHPPSGAAGVREAHRRHARLRHRRPGCPHQQAAGPAQQPAGRRDLHHRRGGHHRPPHRRADAGPAEQRPQPRRRVRLGADGEDLPGPRGHRPRRALHDDLADHRLQPGQGEDPPDRLGRSLVAGGARQAGDGRPGRIDHPRRHHHDRGDGRRQRHAP